MKVHLIRSNDFSAQTYQSVIQILSQYNGPVKFISSETEVEISNAIEVEIGSKDDFEQIKRDHALFSISNASESGEAEACYSMESSRPKIKFPFFTKRTTWDDFFKICNDYRKKNKLPQNDLVILLTDTANDANWFGGSDRNMKNAFVHTAEWHHYFDGLNERFPIAYEVIVWTIRMLILDDVSQMENFWHKEPRGCMSDFCKDKKQIVFKMRTADCCMDCMKAMQKSDVDVRVFGQLFDAMEGIRKYFLSTERSSFLNRPSPIHVKGFMHQLYFPAYGNIELVLNPQERAIYCFYLKHPEGVRLVDLVDFRNEISAYYRRFSAQGTTEAIEASLNNLLDPLSGQMDQVLSRIKRKVNVILGARLAEHYLISGNRGERFKIHLDPDNIHFERDI